MIRRLVFVFMLVLPVGAMAQKFAFELWHEGRVVLESGDTLHGLVKYSMQDDLIQMQVANRLETYTARKVVFFEIFDSSVKRYRSFYSMPYSSVGQYRAPIFFELLEEGKLTVLTRESVETRTYSSFSYYGSYTRLVLVNKYFILKPNGAIAEFKGKKSDFLDLTGAKSDQVAKFIKEKRLDFDKKYEFAEAVAYYNSLF